ncbi:MAG: UvrD-helicase domain-containing protein [Candidatus Liptonbacteria bacterium]|nr:UvrD-helicase domain-containing protein [Candidatus Liptonbacteria bacterium]
MKYKDNQHDIGHNPRLQSAGTDMNPQQKAAAESEKGPLLIVAGAGTGKTKTLTSRLAYFIERGVTPDRICAITFTNKAAKEMEGRVAATYDKEPMTHDKESPTKVIGHKSLVNSPFIGTFHALGARILRREAHLLGRKKNFTIFDDHDSFAIIKKIAKRLVPKKADTAAGKTGGWAVRDTKTPVFLAQKISEIKNVLPPPFCGASASQRTPGSEPQESSGNASPRKRGPSQQEVLAATAFGLYEHSLRENNAFDFDDLIEKPVLLFRNHPDVLKKYQDKFDAILVDEYQDASPMQYELVKLLAGGHKNISAVGDDEQLIYGWRYANLKIFLNFEKDWPGARITFLEENYRSTGNIIAAASEVAKHNLERRPKNLWTKNPDGAMITVAEVADGDEEAEWIAKKVRDSMLDIRISNPEKQATIAVLYRTNAQSRAIEQALIRHGLPYHIFGGLKFYERKEIKDIVAVLRYFVNRSDSVSRERLEKNFSRTKLSGVERVYAAAERKKNQPARFIETILGELDYLGHLERNFANYSERQENIAELIRFATRFESVSDMLQEVALVQSTDIVTNDRRLMTNDKVNSSEVMSHKSLVHLSTIHLAKGLEFDNVFIAGCSEGVLPHERSIEQDKRLEEERRLMYVAMTRAKKKLLISFYDLPSRFISEIPPELIEFENPPPPDQDFADDLEEVFLD